MIALSNCILAVVVWHLDDKTTPTSWSRCSGRDTNLRDTNLRDTNLGNGGDGRDNSLSDGGDGRGDSLSDGGDGRDDSLRDGGGRDNSHRDGGSGRDDSLRDGGDDGRGLESRRRSDLDRRRRSIGAGSEVGNDTLAALGDPIENRCAVD